MTDVIATLSIVNDLMKQTLKLLANLETNTYGRFERKKRFALDTLKKKSEVEVSVLI